MNINLYPQARSTDPSSSFQAAEGHEQTGRAPRNRKRALEAVRLNPGRTSKELATLTGMDRHELARRLPELRADGAIQCRREPGQELRWYYIGQGL